MKETKTLVAIAIAMFVFGIFLGFSVGKHNTVKAWDKDVAHTNELLSIYDYYYREAENLLDSLDKDYNWVDKFNSENYYDAAYLIDSIYDAQGFK